MTAVLSTERPQMTIEEPIAWNERQSGYFEARQGDGTVLNRFLLRGMLTLDPLDLSVAADAFFELADESNEKTCI